MSFNVIPSSWREVWNLFGSYKRQAIYLFVMVVCASFLEAVSIGLLMPMLDLIINENTDSILGNILLYSFGDISSRDALIIVLVVFFLFILLKNVFVLIKINMHGKFSFGMRGYWMKKLMNKYISSDYNYILDNQHGVLINNVLVESEKSQFCLKYIIQFASSFLLTIFMVIVMLITSWEITLYFIVVSGVVVLLSNKLINKYSKEVGTKKIKYARAVGTGVSEGISLIKQIKVLGMESRMINSFNHITKHYIQTLTNFFVLSRVPSRVAEILNVAIIVSSVIYILIFTNLSIKELIPMVAVFVVIGSRMSLQIGQLINSKMEILSNLESLRNVDALIKHEIKTENLDKGKVCDSISGDVEFKNVSFSYVPNKFVLENLNLTIPNGSFTFLIGESGSGKSCVVDLLLRLQSPDSGEIVSNEDSVNDFSKSSWRRRIGYVSQDIMLFNKTIRENILDGNLNASEEDIYTVLKQVNAYDFITSLPDGLDTIVGDRGVKLSGGQRQRLALARALIRDVDLLILDEATSALDQRLEEKIIQEIKSNIVGKTILFITHRLATAVHADIVYKLNQGKISSVSKSELSELLLG